MTWTDDEIARLLGVSERDWRAEIEAVGGDGRSKGGNRRPHGDRALSAIDARDDLIDDLADQHDRDRGEIARLRARLERVEGVRDGLQEEAAWEKDPRATHDEVREGAWAASVARDLDRALADDGGEG